MKSSQFLRSCVLAVAVVVSSVGIIWADGPFSEEVTAYYNVEIALDIHMATVNGVVYHTLSTSGGSNFVEYRRPTSTPAWTVTPDSDETYSYYRVVPQEVQEPLGKTCCEFTCVFGMGGLNPSTNQCTAAGNNCTICIQTCTSGNSTCPRVGKFLAPLTAE